PVWASLISVSLWYPSAGQQPRGAFPCVGIVTVAPSEGNRNLAALPSGGAGAGSNRSARGKAGGEDRGAVGEADRSVVMPCRQAQAIVVRGGGKSGADLGDIVRIGEGAGQQLVETDRKLVAGHLRRGEPGSRKQRFELGKAQRARMRRVAQDF